MKLKSALFVAVSLAGATSSFAGLSMTFSVGNSSFTVNDGDDLDTDDNPDRIFVASLTLTDGIVYRFQGAFSQATYEPNGGLDGAKYSVISNLTTLGNRGTTSPTVQTATQAADDNNGKTVSVYTRYSGFTSIIGEPARAQANVTLSMQGLSMNNANNKSNTSYGAYYDPASSESTVPTGTSIISGTESLFGGSPTNNTEASYSGFQSAPAFTTNTFSLGVFYGIVPTSTTGAAVNEFTFTGSSFLEQTPEPAHTALPVGIATGLLVMRRRRVMR